MREISMALKVLTVLDHARVQVYHFKAIMIAGMGVFTDAYDLFCIPPVMKLVGRLYYEDHDGKLGVTPLAVESAIVAVSFLGAIIGSLVFGALGDRFGRRRVYGLVLLLMVSGSIGCGFSVCRTRTCVLTSLCFFRFVLGAGIGGDYPLSATIMSEFANKRTRGAFIAAVFSMQGFGILASSAVTMAISSAFKRAGGSSRESAGHTPEAADLVWRLILMMGALPAASTVYWRMAMPETARFTALVEQNVIKATHDIGQVLPGCDLQPIPEDAQVPDHPPPPQPPAYGLLSKQFLRRHGPDLFACAAAWFLIDIPYHGSMLFQSTIYQPWFPPPNEVNAYDDAYNVAKFQAVIAVASTISGYWAAVCFIDRAGRRPLQMLGFFFMAVFLFALAGPYDAYWHDHANGGFIVLYTLTFFFANFGPNTTKFIVPAELFPARFRTTCHGIAGAVGKVGAIVGAVGFLWASQDRDGRRVERGRKPGIGMMNALIILGGVCMAGVVLTYMLTPETMGRSLEENEGEESLDNRVSDHQEELQSSSASNASHLSASPLVRNA